MASNPFLNTVAQRIDELLAICSPDRPDAGLLVGLSGGPDSVALLAAARHWSVERGRYLAAAHLDHGLRTESRADVAFCRSLCDRLQVPLIVDTADPRAAARTRGGGIEEAGRHLRHRFFRQLLDADDRLGAVATGHHLDDRIETVLMRLFRGVGPDGLAGIRPVSGRVIHPLLETSRERIVAYLERTGQPWRTDATNLEGDNLRARLRRELIPLVRGMFGPGSERGPLRLAELLDEDTALLERMAASALAECLAEDGRSLRIPVLLDLDPALARRVLRLWLDIGPGQVRPDGLERVHVVSVLDWLRDGQSGSGLDLPGGRRLRREFDTLRCDSGAEVPLRSPDDYRVQVTACTALPAELAEGVGDPADERTWRLTCPVDALQGNLQVRGWRSGDRLGPLGLGGTKKLSDLLRERRVPAEQRSQALVVGDDAGILWVVGVVRSERTRLLPDTTRMVTISVTGRTTSS